MIFDYDIEVRETDKDHVHFLIRYIPRWSIAQMVREVKTTIYFTHLAIAFYCTSKAILVQAYFVV